MEKNKYDLVEWVADMIINSGLKMCEYDMCKHCMFKNECSICNDKETLIEKLLKKYNL